MQRGYTCEGIVADGRVLRDHALLVDDGVITALLPEGEVPSSVELQRLPGAYLTPGLVDIHVHGAAGRGYNEGSPEAAAEIGRALLAAGVTTALPTFASAPLEDMIAGIAPALSHSGEGRPWTPGVHFEGPYFAAAQAGAQDPACLRRPADGTLPRVLEAAEQIRMLSLAPELDGALEAIPRLVDAGIVVAAGHSDGTARDLARAQSAGLSHVTHVFSGQSTTRREGPWRVPGMLEATLASDDLTVEIIADGKHLPHELMVMARRCLGDRLCAVSDATPGAGLSNGSRYVMGGMTYVVDGGVGMTLDGTSFGGSTTLLPSMLPVLVDQLGLGIPDAVAMVTSSPARAARLDRIGRLAPSFFADLALFDEQLKPVDIALRGVWQQLRKDLS